MDDIDIVHEIFGPSTRRYRGRNPRLRNITDYAGKHYMERYRGQYMSTDEFQGLMKVMSIEPFRNTNEYPLRVRTPYYFEWI